MYDQMRPKNYLVLEGLKNNGYFLELSKSEFIGKEMKTFVIVWLVAMSLVLIAGRVWYYLDRKNEKRKKTPMILIAIGDFMMVVFILVLLRIIRK